MSNLLITPVRIALKIKLTGVVNQFLLKPKLQKKKALKL